MKPCFLGNLQRGKTFKTNEEYKEFLQKSNRIFLILSIAGILLAVVGFGAEFAADKFNIPIVIDDYMLGVYAGVGTGLFISGIIVMLSNRHTMKNEQKLTEARIEQTDERIQEIGQKATQTATRIMICSLYVIALIGGLFYPVLPKLLVIILMIFFLSYKISYQIIEKRS